MTGIGRRHCGDHSMDHLNTESSSLRVSPIRVTGIYYMIYSSRVT